MKFICAMCRKESHRNASNQKYCGKQSESGTCANKARNIAGDKYRKAEKKKPIVKDPETDKAAYDYWQA